MQIDVLYTKDGPLYSEITNIISPGEFVKQFIVDASDEHYENKKILFKLINKLMYNGSIKLLCTIDNISSVIKSTRILQETFPIECNITTFFTPRFKQPIYLLDIKQASTISFNKMFYFSKHCDDQVEIYNHIKELILRDSLDRDIIVCVGESSCNNFIDLIKNNCRYFVGLTNKIDDEYKFRNQSIKIEKEI